MSEDNTNMENTENITEEAENDGNISEETEIMTEAAPDDEKAFRELIHIQRRRNAIVSEDINNTDEYEWRDDRLTAIHWDGKLLSGKLELSVFTALEKLECSGNLLTGLHVNDCESLHTLWCFANPMTDLDITNCTSLNNLLFDDTVTVHGDILTLTERAEG